MEIIALIKCGSYDAGSFWGIIEGIDSEDLNNLKKLSKAIRGNSEYWNWTNETKLVKNDEGKWVDERKIYSIYPEVDHNTIDWFISKLPCRTEIIKEIRILTVNGEDRIF